MLSCGGPAWAGFALRLCQPPVFAGGPVAVAAAAGCFCEFCACACNVP